MRLRSWPFRLIVILVVALAGLGVGLAQALGAQTHPAGSGVELARAVSPPAITWLNPLPQGISLTGVDFIDSETGWAVGEDGLVMHSVDGGVTWETQATGVHAYLASPDFIDSQNGWVSGSSPTDSSFLLHTTDGGRTWTRNDITGGLNGGLGSIYFTDADHGLAGGALYKGYGIVVDPVGGTELVANLARTTDGGRTWSRQLVGDARTMLGRMTFADAQRGWVAGYTPWGDRGSVFETSDGGQTWTQLTGLPLIGEVSGISCTSATDLWVLTSDASHRTVLLHSRDGGGTWATVTLPVDANFAALDFASESSGWVSGYYETNPWTTGVKIAHTTDGGQTWTTIDMPNVGPYMLGLAMCHQGAAAAWCVGTGGLMMRTQDGVGWQRMGAPAGWQPLPVDGLYAVEFTSPTHGWVAGQRGAVLETTDGTTWQPRSAPFLHYRAVRFVSADGQKAFALGFDSRIQRYAVVRTDDAGATWRRVRTNEHRQVASDLFFLNAQRGWIAGAQGHKGYLLVTTDGGATWRRIVPTAAGMRLYDFKQIWFSDARHGWAAAQKIITSTHSTTILPTLLRTADGGRTWREVKSRGGGRIDATSLAFEGSRLGWAAGATGVWRTTDGGATWRLSRLWHRWLSGPVRFFDALHGWALASGNGGPIDSFNEHLFFTRDGGRTWQSVTLPGMVWSALAPADAGSAYVIGGNAIIKVTAPAATP